jgi:hypothetical protein
LRVIAYVGEIGIHGNADELWINYTEIEEVVWNKLQEEVKYAEAERKED